MVLRLAEWSRYYETGERRYNQKKFEEGSW